MRLQPSHLKINLNWTRCSISIYLSSVQTKQNKQISYSKICEFYLFQKIKPYPFFSCHPAPSDDASFVKAEATELMAKAWDHSCWGKLGRMSIPKCETTGKTSGPRGSHFLFYNSSFWRLIQQTGVSFLGILAKFQNLNASGTLGGIPLQSPPCGGIPSVDWSLEFARKRRKNRLSIWWWFLMMFVCLLNSCSPCCFLFDYPTKNQFDLTFSLSFAGTRTNYSCTRWHGITYFLRNSTAETLLPNAMSKSVISCCQVLKSVSESKSNSVSWCASLRLYLKHVEVVSLCYQSCWLCWQSVGTSH